MNVPISNEQFKKEIKGLRVLGALSAVAVCLSVGGLGVDLFILTTHQLTLGHRIMDLAALLSFGIGGYQGISIYRGRRRELLNARLPADAAAPREHDRG